MYLISGKSFSPRKFNKYDNFSLTTERRTRARLCKASLNSAMWFLCIKQNLIVRIDCRMHDICLSLLNYKLGSKGCFFKLTFPVHSKLYIAGHFLRNGN